MPVPYLYWYDGILYSLIHKNVDNHYGDKGQHAENYCHHKIADEIYIPHRRCKGHCPLTHLAVCRDGGYIFAVERDCRRHCCGFHIV